MLELLTKIPGPLFLMFFAGVIGVCTLLGRYWVDSSLRYPLPEPERLKPMAFAALKGGWSAVIRTGVFSLWEKKLLQIIGEGKETIIKVTSQPHQPLEPLEEEVYRFLQEERRAGDLFANPVLRARIEKLLEPVYRELGELHLAQMPEDRRHAWTVTALMLLLVTGIGLVKLYLGLTFERPVGILLVMLMFSPVVLLWVIKPYSKLTRLGRRYIREVERQFGWLKDSVQQGKIPQGINPVFPMALFGVGILEGVDGYDPFSQAFRNREYSGGCGGYSGFGGCGGDSGDGGSGGCGGGGD